MRAMLVAAGFGTRLHPLTRELPKPAVPIGNRPAAFFALDHLHRAGVRDFVVNTHHLAAALRAALDPWVPPDTKLRYVHEPEILGTGGGVHNAWRPQAGEDFVVMNAKLLYAPDLEHALRIHRETGAIATMVLRALPEGATFAPVEVDGDGRVRKLRGLPGQAPSTGLQARMYTGVQILSARAHRDLPESGDIIEGAHLRWLERGETVMGVVDEGSGWMDVGVTPTHCLEANLALAGGDIVWPGLDPVDGCLIAPDAQVRADAQLQQCVIGPGATVAAGAVLDRVVAWPGAEIGPGPLSNAIVTTAGACVSCV